MINLGIGITGSAAWGGGGVSAPFWLKTKDKTPVNPTFTGAAPDWESTGSVEGTILNTGAPVFNYATPSTEHLIEATNFDPLTLTKALIEDKGVTEFSSFANFINLREVFVSNNGALTTLTGLEALVNIDIRILASFSNLTGHINTPVAPNMPILWFYGNPLLTSVSTLIGCISLTNVRLDGCALIDSDIIFTEQNTNVQASGSINTSGGTNALVTAASLTDRTDLVNRGVTLTFNGPVTTDYISKYTADSAANFVFGIGSAITTWLDDKGANDLTQAASDQQPNYDNVSKVIFDGINDNITGLPIQVGDFTYMMELDLRVIAGEIILSHAGAARFRVDGSNFIIGTDTDGSKIFGVPNTGLQTIVIRKSGSNLDLFIDNVKSGTTLSMIGELSIDTLARSATSAEIDVLEMRVYDRALTDAEIAELNL